MHDSLHSRRGSVNPKQLPTYTRKFYSFGPNKQKSVRYETYEQPLSDRLKYLAYLGWWKLSWKFKPLSWFIDNVADRIDKKLHDRKCNGDCGVRYSVSDGFTNPKPTCTRVPVNVDQDLKLWDLDNRNNTNKRP